MTSRFRRELFRLPRPRQEPVSAQQLRLLDWLTFGDGQLPKVFHRGVLRSLLRKRWVERIGSSPAVYRVTAYGTAVRSRRGAGLIQRRELDDVSREASDESDGDAAV
jgi:hypothetical protein